MIMRMERRVSDEYRFLLFIRSTFLSGLHYQINRSGVNSRIAASDTNDLILYATWGVPSDIVINSNFMYTKM
jgi:hypothetical protein